MKTSSAKHKGRKLQQRVCSSILKTFPHLNEDDCTSTSMGCNGEDVKLSPTARSVVPLSIECKCQERLNIWAAIDQSVVNTPKGTTPAVIFSKNRSSTYCVLPWEYVLSLLETRSSTKRVPESIKYHISQLASLCEPENSDVSPHVFPSGVVCESKDGEGMCEWEEEEEEGMCE